jgi:hypothetical protein
VEGLEDLVGRGVRRGRARRREFVPKLLEQARDLAARDVEPVGDDFVRVACGDRAGDVLEDPFAVGVRRRDVLPEARGLDDLLDVVVAADVDERVDGGVVERDMLAALRLIARVAELAAVPVDEAAGEVRSGSSRTRSPSSGRTRSGHGDASTRRCESASSYCSSESDCPEFASARFSVVFADRRDVADVEQRDGR